MTSAIAVKPAASLISTAEHEAGEAPERAGPTPGIPTMLYPLVALVRDLREERFVRPAAERAGECVQLER